MRRKNKNEKRIYAQLIDIALDTKDFEWAKQLVNEKQYGKRENDDNESGISFTLNYIGNYTSSSDLTFGYEGEDFEECLKLHYMINNEIEITLKNNTITQNIKGKLKDIRIKDREIVIEVSPDNRKMLNGIYDFYLEKVRLRFKVIES